MCFVCLCLRAFDIFRLFFSVRVFSSIFIYLYIFFIHSNSFFFFVDVYLLLFFLTFFFCSFLKIYYDCYCCCGGILARSCSRWVAGDGAILSHSVLHTQCIQHIICEVIYRFCWKSQYEWVPFAAHDTISAYLSF